MKFRDVLNEELKDPEFRRIYEETSAEEDAKLKAVSKHWKDVPCPTCGAPIGQSCGRQAFGAFHWERTAPHAARKKAATN